MPQHKSCEKRMRTNAAARLRNRRDRSQCRTTEKRILSIKDKAQASRELVEAYSLIDRMADKGVLHKNAAARQKAKLARHIASLSR